MTAKKPKADAPRPRLTAARAWLAQAWKGETFEYWRGDLRKYKMGKTLKDRAAENERLDALAIREFVEEQERRGVVTLKEIIYGKTERGYEMTCIVQRNGLKAVRARAGIKWGAA